jgi:hypothetical protein
VTNKSAVATRQMKPPATGISVLTGAYRIPSD